MLSTLRNRNFSLLWCGGLISVTGDWTLFIGLPIAVYALTRSVAVLSLALLASQIPSILFGSLAGVLVDRWDRRRTLIASNILLAVLLTPLLLLHSASVVWLVYITAFVESSLEQFTKPSENALLPALVGADDLVSANGLISVANNVARLCGPALGGVIAVAYGLNGVVLIDAGSFLIAAMLFTLIRAPQTQPTSAPAQAQAGASLARAAGEWREGLGAIFRQRTLSLLFLIFCVTSIGEGVFSTLLVVFITGNAHGDARAYGGTMSAQAVGGLAGGLLVALVGKRLMSRWSLFICAFLFGAIDLAIFNAPIYFPMLSPLLATNAVAARLSLIGLILALFVVVGIPGVAMSSGLQSIIQRDTPQRLLGRVFGALGSCMALFLALGIALAGWLGPRFNAITLLNIQGAGYVVVAVLLLLFLGKPAAPAPEQTTGNPTAEHVALASE